MFSKLKEITKFKKKDKNLIDLSFITNELEDGLFNILEKSFSERKSDEFNSRFESGNIDEIVKYYTKKNMILAASSSIVPGPMGILGSVPELLLNLGNQMKMIYDLGCANGKENFLCKDLLLDIPIAAFGGNTNLHLLQNSKTDLIDSPEDVLREKVTTLGKSLVEKTLKKSIVQFVPIAGPILMGTWAKMTTLKISNGSIMFFREEDQYVEHVKKQETEEIKTKLLTEKIKGLANLIEVNEEINEDQIELIGTIIENSGLNEKEKQYYLEESLKVGSNFKLNNELLIDYEEDESLILEMVIMAKRSGQIDKFEKEYIYKTGEALNIKKSFIDELF